MEWYVGVLKKYADFTGRARRKEYWMFFLFNLIVMIGLSIVEGIIGLAGILSGLYSLAVLIPSIAVAARRLHDTDRSGWWQLIVFIPLIGVIILLIFLVQDGKGEENRFGSNPKLAGE